MQTFLWSEIRGMEWFIAIVIKSDAKNSNQNKKKIKRDGTRKLEYELYQGNETIPNCWITIERQFRTHKTIKSKINFIFKFRKKKIICHSKNSLQCAYISIDVHEYFCLCSIRIFMCVYWHIHYNYCHNKHDSFTHGPIINARQWVNGGGRRARIRFIHTRTLT